jgi:hypothetical protein
MTTALLGGVALPAVLAGTVVAALALRRVVKRKVTETPPGRVVIACNLAESRRRVRR